MAGYFRRALLWNWLWIICQLNSFPRNPQSLIRRSSSKFVHMLARIEIPFPVFLPNPGLMSAKQINNSTSVGNAEKRVKNNLNKKIMKMNYKTVFFPKKSTTNHLLPLNNLVKNNSLESMCLSLLSSVTDAREFLKSNFPLLVLVFLTPAGKSQLLETILLTA